MAERRMFAKSIVLSDAFLDMPMSARCLYFTLNMFADDDGFVGSPKGIMRQCGASEDDIKLLIAKKFVLAFESGVIVIKHWRINNYLQNDRHKDTTYLDEKTQLAIKEDKSYTWAEDPVETGCIQNVYNLDTQGRLGKDSIGKDSVVEALPPTTTDQIEIIIREWNAQDITRNIDKIPFGKARYNSTMMCIGTDFDGFIHSIQTLKEQEFLTQWAKEKPIGYDWFLENYQKVVEGNYSKVYEKKPEKKGTEFQNFSQRKYDFKALEPELLAR